MVLPVFFIANMGRIIPIFVTIGTALARFVAKNPKILGGTISVQAISAAIQSHESTEKEKMTQEEKKKGKKFFVKKKLTREILFNTSSHNPICNI